MKIWQQYEMQGNSGIRIRLLPHKCGHFPNTTATIYRRWGTLFEIEKLFTFNC